MSSSQQELSRLLSPEVLSRIGNLPLMARQAVSGFYAGFHNSLKHGYDGEFVQYKPYVPGDDVRYVDWKQYARLERLSMKVFRERTDMPVALIVDATGSMDYQGQRSAVSKYRYCSMAALCLAVLVQNQGDRCGLFIYGGGKAPQAVIPSGNGLEHFAAALTGTNASGTGTLSDILPMAETFTHGRGITVIFSDFHEDEGLVEKNLKGIHHGNGDVIVFHVLDSDEEELPFDEPLRFIDSETAQQMDTVSAMVREDYQLRMKQFKDMVRNSVIGSQSDYVFINTAEHLGNVLFTYLSRRK